MQEARLQDHVGAELGIKRGAGNPQMEPGLQD